MAAALYLISRSGSDGPETVLINGLWAMITNADDGDPDATKISEAEAVAVAAGHAIPSGYFDTVQQLGVPTGGIMDTDEDAIIMLPRTKTQVIA